MNRKRATVLMFVTWMCVACEHGSQLGSVPDNRSARVTAAPFAAPISQPGPSSAIVSDRLGLVLWKGEEGDLRVARYPQDQRRWAVKDGEWEKKIGLVAVKGDPVDSRGRIDRLLATEGMAIVRVNLAAQGRDDAFRASLGRANPEGQPALADVDGGRYPAIGYVLTTPTVAHVRFTKAEPLKHLSDLPPASASGQPLTLALLFEVRQGARICEFRAGEDIIELYDPPVDIAQQAP
jgi:hypothetical protein